MKAYARVMTAFNEPLSSEAVDVPRLAPGQVLVRLTAAGVCGSDVHQWRGEDPRIPLPLIPGHEGVGDVVDTGGQVRDIDGGIVAPGDSIIWNRGVSCGSCHFCAVLRQPALCPNRSVYGITMPRSEPPHLNGCYADHIVLRSGTHIIKLPDTMDPAVMVPASCSGATAAHAFGYVRGGLVGRTVVVQGPGPLGVFAVAFARAAGASTVIVIGGTPERLALCRDFGATHGIDRHGFTVDERRGMVMDLTGGRGADVVIEAVGARGVAEEGVRLLRRGGLYLTTGYAQPVGEDAIDFYRDIVLRNITVQGVWVSDTGHLRRAVDLVLSAPELYARLVTHRFPLDRADEALAVMREREALKAVLIPGGARVS